MHPVRASPGGPGGMRPGAPSPACGPLPPQDRGGIQAVHRSEAGPLPGRRPREPEGPCRHDPALGRHPPGGRSGRGGPRGPSAGLPPLLGLDRGPGGSSPQGVAAVSPRGEGTYECLCECQSPEDARAFLAHLPPPGDLAITYGTPVALTAKGFVQFRCRSLRALRKERFSTDLLDYGREYLLHGDPKDCMPVPAP